MIAFGRFILPAVGVPCMATFQPQPWRKGGDDALLDRRENIHIAGDATKARFGVSNASNSVSLRFGANVAW